MARETIRNETNPSSRAHRLTVMKICLVISLLFHLSILLAIQKAFPIQWVQKPMRTYKVEFIRPPTDPIDDVEKPDTDLARIKKEDGKQPEKTEDTISLDTKDERYLSYATAVKKRLMLHWSYPKEAWENLIEGTVLVIFSLHRDGNLKEIKLLKPSMSHILNKEAVRAIRSAAPFPPFPGSVSVVKLNIKANFAYRLTAGSQ